MLVEVGAHLIILVQLVQVDQAVGETPAITIMLVNKMVRLILVEAVVVMKVTTIRLILPDLLVEMVVQEL
jgi:hypothetical protein